MKRWIFAAVAALSLLASQRAEATIVVAVDLDTTTAGLQSTRSVLVGSAPFRVEVVVFDTGTSPGTTFDTAIAQINYTGGITPTGAPTLAGAYSAAPLTVDAFSPLPFPLSIVTPGAALTPFPVGIPAPTYTANTANYGIFNPGTFTAGAAPMSVFSYEFSPTAVGTTSLNATGTVLSGPLGPIPSPALAFGGSPVAHLSPPSLLTVRRRSTGGVIPEPGTFAIWGLGSLLIFGSAARRRKSRKQAA